MACIALRKYARDCTYCQEQAELIVIGKLLERGFKICTLLIDTGIDCLVDVGEGNYKEIHIKYREDQAVFAARKFITRDNFYMEADLQCSACDCCTHQSRRSCPSQLGLGIPLCTCEGRSDETFAYL